MPKRRKGPLRAGIPHRVTTREQESAFLSAAEMVGLVKEAGLGFEPGEKSVYSSAGYSVLARIIEIVEGKPYGQAARERIFIPAGMSHSLHRGHRRLVPDRGQQIEVRVEGGGVWAGDRVLVPTSETTFFSPQDYGTVTVVFDESRKVIGLDWNWKGEFMTRFTRVGESGEGDPS